MSGVEVFLDETPGETRGVIARDGVFHTLLIQREDDPPAARLGARSVVRVASVDPAFDAAFVEMEGGRSGFLSFGAGPRPREGEAVEAVVAAEPRDGKGATLRRTGPAEGAPRLLEPGASVIEILRELAPGVEPVVGRDAIQAAWDAEEMALAPGEATHEVGMDLVVERTRAMVVADVDYAHVAGRDIRRGRLAANRRALFETARIVALKSWGGLIAIDLVGTRLNADQITRDARLAFAPWGEQVVMGPVSRFGVLQLSVPWTRTPIEQILRPTPATRAIAGVRVLRHALLSDPGLPRLVLCCAPDEAAKAAPWVARLGPRAHIQADPARPPGSPVVQEPDRP